MFSHIMVGSNNIDKAAEFYDTVLEPFGATRFLKNETRAGYSTPDGGRFIICTPFDKSAATFGNGTMISFKAPSAAAVDTFYKAALAAGGKDEGAPGPRGTNNPPPYVAYVRDPDGNKLAALHRP
jgi:catechol 2,3-dioxygenase-like lactoylglutathione lyase family enzyme